MAKGLKIEIFGYRIMCVKSGKFISKACSHKFSKEKELKEYIKEHKPKYENKYPGKTINSTTFGETVNIDFFIRRKK